LVGLHGSWAWSCSLEGCQRGPQIQCFIIGFSIPHETHDFSCVLVRCFLRAPKTDWDLSICNSAYLTQSDHSSNLRGQITQMKQKPKFVWLRAYDHTSKPNRTNHTNLNKSKNWVKQEIKSHELCIPSKKQTAIELYCNYKIKPL